MYENTWIEFNFKMFVHPYTAWLVRLCPSSFLNKSTKNGRIWAFNTYIAENYLRIYVEPISGRLDQKKLKIFTVQKKVSFSFCKSVSGWWSQVLWWICSQVQLLDLAQIPSTAGKIFVSWPTSQVQSFVPKYIYLFPSTVIRSQVQPWINFAPLTSQVQPRINSLQLISQVQV